MAVTDWGSDGAGGGTSVQVQVVSDTTEIETGEAGSTDAGGARPGGRTAVVTGALMAANSTWLP